MEQPITGILTNAGKRHIATQALANQGLDVADLVLANVPYLDESAVRNPDMSLPPVAQIVYREHYQIKGYVDDNTVAWASVLDQDIGDFDYNWVGLVTAGGILLALDYLPLQRKRQGVNNVHNRSFVLKFAAAKALSRIEIPASSWMFDYSPHLNTLDLNVAVQAKNNFDLSLLFLQQDDRLRAVELQQTQ